MIDDGSQLDTARLHVDHEALQTQRDGFVANTAPQAPGLEPARRSLPGGQIAENALQRAISRLNTGQRGGHPGRIAHGLQRLLHLAQGRAIKEQGLAQRLSRHEQHALAGHGGLQRGLQRRKPPTIAGGQARDGFAET